jgi:predicted amidohydrolase YtcJ
MSTQLFYGVPFYTMNSNRTVAEAVVIRQGVIEYVSERREEALNLYPAAELVEFNGGCFLPGFIDPHIQLKSYSLLYRDLDLSSIDHKNDVINAIEEALQRKKDGEWLTAGGLKKVILDELAIADLDTVSRKNPLVLFTGDTLSAIVNSRALIRASIDKNRIDPLGGTIDRDENNKPTGVLHGRAVGLVRGKLPIEPVERVDEALERGLEKILSQGITTFCDYATNAASSSTLNLMKIAKRRPLKGRTVLMLGDRETARLGEIGITSSFGNDRLRLGGLALVVDGTFKSKTAYMSIPYLGSQSNGMLLMDGDELYSLLKKNYSHYIWAAVHCVGDKANEIALVAFERIRKETGIPDMLMRVDHAQFLKDEDIDRFASTGVVAVMNTVQIPQNRERVMRYLGRDAVFLSRLGSLAEAGAKIAISSNAPQQTVNPLIGLYSAVERRGFEDGPELRFHPRESITLSDAVYAYTMGGATACDMQREVGSMEKGKAADLVYLSRDIMTEGVSSLKETEVLSVFVDGEAVYERNRAESRSLKDRSFFFRG